VQGSRDRAMFRATLEGIAWPADAWTASSLAPTAACPLEQLASAEVLRRSFSLDPWNGARRGPRNSWILGFPEPPDPSYVRWGTPGVPEIRQVLGALLLPLQESREHGVSVGRGQLWGACCRDGCDRGGRGPSVPLRPPCRAMQIAWAPRTSGASCRLQGSRVTSVATHPVSCWVRGG
jgi:hypothetical protein